MRHRLYVLVHKAVHDKPFALHLDSQRSRSERYRICQYSSAKRFFEACLKTRNAGGYNKLWRKDYFGNMEIRKDYFLAKQSKVFNQVEYFFLVFERISEIYLEYVHIHNKYKKTYSDTS